MPDIVETIVGKSTVLVCTFSGVLTRSSIFDFLLELRKYGHLQSERHMLADFSDVIETNIDVSDLAIIAGFINANMTPSFSTACVTGDNLKRFILGNIFAGLINYARSNKVAIFKFQKDALDFLRREDTFSKAA